MKELCLILIYKTRNIRYITTFIIHERGICRGQVQFLKHSYNIFS
ncbi:MAG: hypothetical protein ACI83B_002971 [Sediminicola sp.]|jgi:hypothetical protein